MLRTFFVYGTLMTGCVNHHVISREAIEQITNAKISGMELYMYKGAYYPCMVVGEGEVVGELITVKEEFFEQILARVDRLEGYVGPKEESNFYDRMILEVQNEKNEQVTAYSYVYNHKHGNLGQKIVNGNFKSI